MKWLVTTDLNKDLNSSFFRTWESFFENPVRSENVTDEYNQITFAPACDALETDSLYLLSIDVPGMKRDEIKIELNSDTITVSGERNIKDKNLANLMQHNEKKYGHFKRTFRIPSTIDLDKVEARYEDGVLELFLPKTVLARPRTVEIQSGKTTFFDKVKEESIPKVN